SGSQLDTAYWGFLGARIRRIFLDGYDVLVFRTVVHDVSKSWSKDLWLDVKGLEASLW
ncbi:hypothetical protein Tco_0638335, partial [Tanacetum coccineum]